VFPDIKPGTITIAIHAHGSNFQNLLNKSSMQMLIRGEIPEAECRDLIELMRKQAEINRAAISLKFLEHLRSRVNTISAKTIIDQSHREIEWLSETNEVVYYNDSQKIVPQAKVFLPFGSPNGHSYLVSGGNQTVQNQNGISHNLKIPGRDGINTDSEMTLVEAEAHPLRACFAQRTRVALKKVPIVQSANCQQLIDTMKGRGVIQNIATLRPLIRYHVKRLKEKPWSRIGLQ
jgi:hypothetical protein